jgi:hypothetical protein
VVACIIFLFGSICLFFKNKISQSGHPDLTPNEHEAKLLHFCHLQIGFPRELTMQMVPGPQGEGLQGSGLSMQRWFWQM